MGQVAGAIEDVKPAKQIVDEMVSEAVAVLGNVGRMVNGGSKL